MIQAMKIILMAGVMASGAAMLANSYGYREDYWSAFGGLMCLGIGWKLFPATQEEWWWDPQFADYLNPGHLLTAYFIMNVVFLAIIGWLTGWIHRHGAFEGAISGGLSGFLLAIIIPLLQGTRLFPFSKPVWIALSFVAFAGLLAIIGAMYAHVFQ